MNKSLPTWPVRPDRITLRVCEDLDWRVMIHCPNCRYSSGVNSRMLAGHRLGGEPLPKLLERGVFKCRRKKGSGPPCPGVKATRLDVSCMDVGLSRNVAAWTVTWPRGLDQPGSARLEPF